MEENWCIYCKEEAGPRTVCLIDLGAGENGPDPSRPKLLTIRVRLRETNEDGLNAPAETERLHALEDDLVAPFVGAEGPWYVGRLTSQGVQQFFFYLPADFAGAEAAAAKAAAAHAGYRPHCDIVDDPDWGFYFDRLAPTELETHLTHSAQLVEMMEEHGDDGEEPRRVDHWLYFRTPDDREAFKERLGALGYAIEGEWNALEKAKEEGDDEGELSEQSRAAPFALQIHREQSVTLPLICDAIRELNLLAEEAGGSYDGWETEHKGDEPPGLEDHECGPGCGH